MKGKSSISLVRQQVLRDTAITDNAPGTILRDFQMLLDFIDEERAKVSSTHNLFHSDLLLRLNLRLCRPMDIRLKRPQQKSYAYINALYLLLRATGLGRIERVAANEFLILDKDVLQSWRSLNATERYFTLLEAWLVRGKPEILGESRGFFDHIGGCLRFLQKIPDEGLKIAGNRNLEQIIPFQPGLYNAALLDLFGLISIEQGQPEEGRGWIITSAHRTEFGDALLHLVASHFSHLEFSWEYDSDTEAVFGELQPIIQPYFPEWQNNLTLPDTEFRDGTYIFRVSLGKVWRRIAIRADAYLEGLSDYILKAFKFDHDHLYCFTYKNRFGIAERVNHPFIEEAPYTTEARIGELPLQVGASLTYLYDFGDQWEFDVKLESIEKVDPKMSKPKIVESHGKAPEQYPGSEEWDER